MRRVLAGAAAAALLLAGCGGSSGPHLSEAAYQHQGAAICTRYQSAIRKLGVFSA